MSNRIMITAHSGCLDTKMNSMEYLERAVGLRADIVELDILKNREGTLVLSHDFPDKKHPVRVTLEEAFRFLCGSEKKINCDLKQHDLVMEVLECAAQCFIPMERIIFTGSYNEESCEYRKKNGVDVYINPEELISDFYKMTEENREEKYRNLIDLCKENEYDVININYRYVDSSLAEMCKKNGIAMSLWTIDEKEAFDYWQIQPVINITTKKFLVDEPAGIRSREYAESN